MQHLGDVYQGDWMKYVRVGYFEALDDCCSIKRFNWTYESFVSFPKQHGYRIDGNHRLHESGLPRSCTELERPAFMQAWLFFMLIHCVVRDDKNPFLDRKALVDKRQLNTKDLPKALNDWSSHMIKLYQTDARAATMRILEANQILELAKQVVLANLAETPPLTHSATTGNTRRNGNRSLAVQPIDQRNICIMILGETLSAVLTRLIKKCNVKLSGWELDDGGGWGPPAYVSNVMSKDWCPRSQATIKGQLGRNATLLYITLLAHHDNLHNRHSQFSHTFEEHCTPLSCPFIEAEHDLEQGRSYSPSHHPTCGMQDKCDMVGPIEEHVLKVLEEDDNSRTGSFPLMRVFKNVETDKLEVKVEAWKQGTAFATISHVWSQGLGNRIERKIRMCQLVAIQNLVSKVFEDGGSHPFWLDTFAIPQARVETSRHTKLKQKATGLIHHIFKTAQHCIIIDRHVMTAGRTFNCGRTIGAELLASGWMMRLWTLQEAFVSRQLHIALCDQEEHQREPPSLDGIWLMSEDQEAFAESMTEMMKRKVDQGLMKGNSIESVADQSNTERALLIASAWGAVRYRTTRNPGEETLALSSLLGIPISRDDNGEDPSTTRVEDLETLMVRFWTAISRHPVLGKAIPPGIIFLSGKRLSRKGFRWAPATWMSGVVEAYPFPLDNPKFPTQLISEGLVVQFPGFLLHSNTNKLHDIISTNSNRNAFDFCVGRGLNEWYRVVAARKKNQAANGSATSLDNGNHDQHQISQDLKKRLNAGSSLRIGIILSRPRPVEVQGEIGLLVEIYSEKPCRSEDGHPIVPGSCLYCRIVRRVEVTRLSTSAVEDSLRQEGDWLPPGDDPILSRHEKFRQEKIAGVHMDDTQGWCVDGFTSRQPLHSITALSRRHTGIPQPVERPVEDPGIFSRLKRTLTVGGRFESSDQ